MEKMLVGTLQIKLYMSFSHSLKEKRRVIRSIKDRVHNKFNVSISEVALNDSWQTSILGVAKVSNESKFLTVSLSKIVEFLRKNQEIEILQYHIEIF